MSFLKSLDWKLNSAVLFLAFASLASLMSTTPGLFWKQVLWWGIGLALLSFVLVFDWRPFLSYRGVIFGMYFFMVLLLVFTYFFAPTIRGNRGWLQFGSFQFQPAEFLKIALIIIFARFFSQRHVGIAHVSNIVISFFYFFIPAIFVAFQPDFGTMLILFSLWFGFLLVSGIQWRHLAIGFLIFSVLLVGMWVYVLQDYQKDRVLGLFFPDRDPLGVNYSVIQSKIAIGSAGLFGKGFGQGTQSQLGFLPEAHTDFIFAAFIEEWGLLMGLLLIIAFFFVVYRIIRIGLLAENNFNRFVCLGAAILFSIQFVLNVGSNIGLTPVIGVTFPFLSYGGSSLLTNLLLIGMIQSISSRRTL